MKKIRVGINGFGRIGRQVFRALHQSYRDRVEVVAINDLFDAESNFHLLEYDSVYGRAHLDAKVGGQDATVGDWKIHCFAERDPKQLTWGAYDVDIVVESTGIFRSATQAAVHIELGQGDLRGAVQALGFAQDHHVQPTAAAGAARRR